MKVFVLGAGASTHAGYPLGTRLGEELVAWAERDQVHGPQFRDQLRQLKEEFGGLSDFERVVTVLRDELLSKKRKSLPDLGTAISKFFDAIRNQPAALYDRLVAERIQSGDVVLTFNYDLTIERSLKAAGLWEIDDGYGTALTLGVRGMPATRVKVLKLHGSTNWWGAIFAGAQGFSVAHSSIGDRPVLFFTPDFEFLGYTNVRDPRAPSRSGLVSALIWPTQGKQFFLNTTFGNEWERFWNAIWWEAESALRTADEIVVLGYTSPLADERARELLLENASHSAGVTVCCHSQSPQIAKQFESHGFRHVTVPADPTFQGWLDTPLPAVVGAQTAKSTL